MSEMKVKKPIPVVLASASKRRKNILKELGIPHRIRIPSIREKWKANESPEDISIRLALEKARNVNAPESLVIGMDTIVVTGKTVLGKPATEREAMQMLKLLSGKTHRVISGIALIYRGNQSLSYDETRVHFRKIQLKEMQWYVKSGEPFDKAGGYAIQDKARLFVDRIEGCYFNVVGFPLNGFQNALAKLGLTIYDLIRKS
jgi:septum formation protein